MEQGGSVGGENMQRLQWNRERPMAARDLRSSTTLALLLVANTLLTSLAWTPPSVSAYAGNES